jgi:hypothetical protein
MNVRRGAHRQPRVTVDAYCQSAPNMPGRFTVQKFIDGRFIPLENNKAYKDDFLKLRVPMEALRISEIS